MAPKRKLEDGPAPARGEAALSKKARTAKKSAAATVPTVDEMRAMPHDQLLEAALNLHIALNAAQAQLTSLEAAKPLSETAGNSQKSDSAWTPEKVTEKARQLRQLAAKGIKKQMKWQPSCKNGTTKWSFEGIAPNKDVFLRMVGVEAGGKPFKQKKIPIRDFQNKFGYISASSRYTDLSITGENVNVHWKEDESTFKLSGTYGI